VLKKEITARFTDHSIRRVVQAVEPEAANLLTAKGGSIARADLHGMFYWDDYPLLEQTALSWPPGTIAAYVSGNGQEDTTVVFAVFLLPAAAQELHMVYDYRRFVPYGSFEEYIVLRVAHEQENILCAEEDCSSSA